MAISPVKLFSDTFPCPPSVHLPPCLEEEDPCAALFSREIEAQKDFDEAIQKIDTTDDKIELVYMGQCYDVYIHAAQRMDELIHQIPPMYSLDRVSFSGKAGDASYIAYEKTDATPLSLLDFSDTWRFPEEGRFIHPCLAALSDDCIKEALLFENRKNSALLEKRHTALLHLKFLSLRSIAQDLVRAITHLHSHHIVHRQIQPEHIMLKETGAMLRLGENMRCLYTASGTLGWPRELRKHPLSPLPLAAYSAPDSIGYKIEEHSRYNRSIDLYSLSSCLLYLATGCAPQEPTTTQSYHAIYLEKKQCYHHFPQYLPSVFIELLELLRAPSIYVFKEYYDPLKLAIFTRNTDELFREMLSEVLSRPSIDRQHLLEEILDPIALARIKEEIKASAPLSFATPGIKASLLTFEASPSVWIQAWHIPSDTSSSIFQHNLIRSFAISRCLPPHPRILNDLYSWHEEDVFFLAKQRPISDEAFVLSEVRDGKKRSPFQLSSLENAQTISSLIKRCGKETQEFLQKIESIQNLCRQMIDILTHLHRRGIFLRSLTLDALCLCPKMGLMLFDLSQAIYEGSSNGYPPWIEAKETPTELVLMPLKIYAPEHVDASLPLDPRVDLFTAAAIIYELVTDQPLFAWSEEKGELRDLDTLKESFYERINSPESFGHLHLPESLIDMLQSLMRYNPYDRISLTLWSYHPFLRRSATDIVREYVDKASRWTYGL